MKLIYFIIKYISSIIKIKGRNKKSPVFPQKKDRTLSAITEILLFLYPLCPRILRILGTQDSGELLRIGVLELLQDGVQACKRFRTFGNIKKQKRRLKIHL